MSSYLQPNVNLDISISMKMYNKEKKAIPLYLLSFKGAYASISHIADLYTHYYSVTSSNLVHTMELSTRYWNEEFRL